MATLAEAVDAGETDWIISAGITADFLTVESETVAVLTHFPVQLDPQTRLPLPPRIRVQRGAGGTTAASHADGTTLTPLIPPAASGESGGAIAVDNTVDPPFDASTFVAPGATESAPGEATLPLGSILTDPGALWEAEHEYVTGDRVLVWDTVVFESQSDGLSGAIEPEWDTIVGLGDGDITWDVIGELGQLNNALMPIGLGLFALTSPSNLGIPLTDHEAVTTTIHGIPDTADLATTSDVTGAVVDHAALQGAHHILSGAADPSAGGGVAASPGDLYVRTNAQIWMKFGPTDTEWRCVIDPTALWLDSSGDVMTNALFPTADPAVVGKLWADAGTLKVSAG